MNKKRIYLILGALAAIVAIYVVFWSRSPAPQNVAVNQGNQNIPATLPTATVIAPTDNTTTVNETFIVTGQNFSFSPAQLKVKKGEVIKIIFKNTGGMHDFVLDEFNVRTSRVQDGGEEAVIFTADKTGSFEYYCSVGSHRAMGLTGTLMVE